MPTDENRAIMQQFGEAMDRQDAAFLQAHPGLADTASFYQHLWAAFPDLQGAVQETISEGAWIAQRVLVSGTMQGVFMGLAPTGKPATWEVIQTCCRGRFRIGSWALLMMGLEALSWSI